MGGLVGIEITSVINVVGVSDTLVTGMLVGDD